MLAEAEPPSDARAARDALVERLKAVAAGDRAAFRAVYAATNAKLFGVILRILSDRETAEDVLQETYTAVWTKAGQFDPARASPVTWLAAVARNKALDRLRAGARPAAHRPLDEAVEVADEAEGAEDALARSQEYARLRACLDELEPAHAGYVRVAFHHGRTYDTLAGEAGVPVGTMKSWIRRALLKLRGCLA